VYSTVAIIPKYTLKLVCSSQSHFLFRSELITPLPKPIPKEYNELTQKVVRTVSKSKRPWIKENIKVKIKAILRETIVPFLNSV
jgi:hypothetical protein